MASHRQPRAPHQRTGEQFGEVAGLFVALDRREQQLDRPLRREPFGFQRIGEAESAHHEVGPRRAATIELLIDILPFAEHACRSAADASSAAKMLTVQVRRADLDRACIASSRARNRASGISSCESGNKNMRFPANSAAVAGDRPPSRVRAADAVAASNARGRRQTPPPRPAAITSSLRRQAGKARRSAARRAPPALARFRPGMAAPAGSVSAVRPAGASAHDAAAGTAPGRCPARRTAARTDLPRPRPARRRPAARRASAGLRQHRDQRREAGILALA